MAEKATIKLYDYYWQMCLAAQRLVLIKRALGIEIKDYNETLDWIEEVFNDVELDEDGECTITCGFLTMKGWKDLETKEQKIDFYFDLAAN